MLKCAVYVLFSVLAFRPHETGFEGTKKPQAFRNGILSRVEILENAGFLFTCGRTKNCYDNIKTS